MKTCKRVNPPIPPIRGSGIASRLLIFYPVAAASDKSAIYLLQAHGNNTDQSKTGCEKKEGVL
jgi:hypothetical protein